MKLGPILLAPPAPLVAINEFVKRKPGEPACAFQLGFFRETRYISHTKISHRDYMPGNTKDFLKGFLMNNTNPSHSNSFCPCGEP